MRQGLVAGNWKMNASSEAVSSLMEGIVAGMATVDNVEVVVCPPFPYLSQVAGLVGDGASIGVGAQNICLVSGTGAYTGEVSDQMLKDIGCQYVIVGHSERRSLYGETDAVVAEKYDVVHAAGMTPILCVGESLEERESGQTEAVVARQLDALLDSKAGVAGLASAVIAYEPVWAIGTGMTATPEQAQDVHAFIRQRIAERDAGIAEGLRLLYGGSVKGSNAEELFAKPDIDGGLIGGASLMADDFLAICRAAKG